MTCTRHKPRTLVDNPAVEEEEEAPEPPVEEEVEDVDVVIEEAEPIAVELSNAPAAQELRGRFDIDGMGEIQEEEEAEEVPEPIPEPEPAPVAEAVPGAVGHLMRMGYMGLVMGAESAVEEDGVKVLEGMHERAKRHPLFNLAMDGIANKHGDRVAPYATPEAILALVTAESAAYTYMYNTRFRKRPREDIIGGEEVIGEPDPKRQRLRESTDEEDLEVGVV